MEHTRENEPVIGDAPAVSEPLSVQEDAFGRLLLDYLAGEAGQLILELDDGRAGPALPADVFFTEHREWPAPEQQVFEFVHGRVLDVGCGAGRHSLEAQRRGLGVVAIDISPGAVEVCRRRGVRDVRLLPLAAVDASLGAFDTVLMMCGNFGLVGTAKDAVLVLRTLHGMTAPSAIIVLDSVDPHQDTNPADLAYQEENRARGRLPGQVTIRLRYRGSATPWFELLNLRLASSNTWSPRPGGNLLTSWRASRRSTRSSRNQPHECKTLTDAPWAWRRTNSLSRSLWSNAGLDRGRGERRHRPGPTNVLSQLSAAGFRANLLGDRSAPEEKDQQVRLERRLLMLVRHNLRQLRKHFVGNRERLQ